MSPAIALLKKNSTDDDCENDEDDGVDEAAG